MILDQFEELFTLQSAEARTTFIANLGSLVRGVPPSTTLFELDATNSGSLRSELTETPPALRLVFSLREDYLGYLEETADWIPQILDQRFRLTPLSAEAAVEAMTGPAGIDDTTLLTKPFVYKPEAVTTIINYLSQRFTQTITHTARYVEPFQLQLICTQIESHVVEQQQRTGSAVTVSLADIGGEAALKATLTDFYKQELRALPRRRQRRAVRRLCEELLVSHDGRRLSLDEREITRQLRLSDDTLRKLVDRRLLRTDQRADSQYYELSHDTLIEPILRYRRLGDIKDGFVSLLYGILIMAIVAILSLGAILMFSTTAVHDGIATAVIMAFTMIASPIALLLSRWPTSRCVTAFGESGGAPIAFPPRDPDALSPPMPTTPGFARPSYARHRNQDQHSRLIGTPPNLEPKPVSHGSMRRDIVIASKRQ